MNQYTVHIDMACVPDRLMMIKMASVLDNDRCSAMWDYFRAAPTFGGESVMERQRGGLALIGWDHLKAFRDDDTKKGDKTVRSVRSRRAWSRSWGKFFQSDDTKKSDTIMLQGVRCRRPDQITMISLRIVGLGDAPMQPLNSTDTKKHIVVVIAGALEML
ncbi:hypothetical protein K439DRAFT_1624818 [Ramaria rubella]|nr:hypothetical protein K439DRAFT_1624818 [Ramaria rubella]